MVMLRRISPYFTEIHTARFADEIMSGFCFKIRMEREKWVGWRRNKIGHKILIVIVV